MLTETLSLDEVSRLTLASQIFTAAVGQVRGRGASNEAKGNLKILSRPVEERELRLGLESSLRGLARSTIGDERIHLVDQANLEHPQPLT